MNKFSTKIKIREGLNDVRLSKIFEYIKAFALLNFRKANTYHFESRDREVGLLILEGRCDVEIDGKEYRNLGSRRDVFSGLPTGVYIPRGSKFSIESQKATIAICQSKCGKRSESAVIYPKNLKIMNVGKQNWSREVRIIIGPDSPSINLILGETINPPGNWSGTPPHKHENDDWPRESYHEELYYFKIDRPQGWGIERLYSKERSVNELIYLEENVVTFIPWGYHQVVAAPGYTLYYLFFLAGKDNKLVGFEDPDHSWIKNI